MSWMIFFALAGVVLLYRRLVSTSRIAHQTWRRPGLRVGIYETGDST